MFYLLLYILLLGGGFMFVPCIPRVRVVNKTIVYSDTVIKLDSLGKDLKISSIDNISEHELENCIKCIFENNQDVLFNTIQYSRQAKKIYFYIMFCICSESAPVYFTFCELHP